MKKQLIAAATVLTVSLITGCGSNGSMNQAGSTMMNQPSAGKSVIAGTVADGYLANATVFMDKNGNYLLDPGEPFATTDANGAYSLTVDAADLGKYPIIALAIKGVTIDLDNPTQTVSNSYVMSLPKDSVTGKVSSNFISPISSQLHEMMATGKYATIDDAMAALAKQMGLPVGTNMLQNFMASKHEGMHTAAQNIANLMGTQMPQVMGPAGTTTAVKVDRYRGMMGIIFSNMSSIRGANAQANMPVLANMMTATLGNMPVGTPYRNMSSAFRGGMGMMGR